MGCGASSIANKKEGNRGNDNDKEDDPRRELRRAAAVMAAGRARDERRRRQQQKEDDSKKQTQSKKEVKIERPTPCIDQPQVFLMNGPVCSYGLGSRQKKSPSRAPTFNVFSSPSPRYNEHPFTDGAIDPPSQNIMREAAKLDQLMPNTMPRSHAALGLSPPRRIDPTANTNWKIRAQEKGFASSVFVFLRGSSVPLVRVKFSTQRVTFGQLRKALTTSVESDLAIGGSSRMKKQLLVGKWSFGGIHSMSTQKEMVTKIPLERWPPGVVRHLRMQGTRLDPYDTYAIVVEPDASIIERGGLCTSWFDMVHEGDVDGLEHMMNTSAVSATSLTDAMGRTALHWAAEDGDAALCRRLITYGVDLQARDHNGRTCLHVAVEACRGPVVSMLLEHAFVAIGDVAATAKFFAAPDCRGFSAVHVALLRKMQAVDKGASRRAQEFSTLATRIFSAVAEPESTRLLWSMIPHTGCNLHMLSLRANTTLLDAVQTNNTDRIEAIQNHVLVSQYSLRSEETKVQQGECTMTQNLILTEGLSVSLCVAPNGALCPNICGITALHVAAGQSDRQVLRCILETFRHLKLNIDVLNSSGEPAAFHALRNAWRYDASAALMLFKEYSSTFFQLRTATQANVLHVALGRRAASRLTWLHLIHDPQFVPSMLCEPDTSGVTPLHLAFSASIRLQEESLLLLLKKADVMDLLEPLTSPEAAAAPHFSYAPPRRNQKKSHEKTKEEQKPVHLSHQLYCLSIQRQLAKLQQWFRNTCPPHLPQPPTSAQWHPLFHLCRKGSDASVVELHAFLKQYPDGLLSSIPDFKVECLQEVHTVSAAEYIILTVAREHSGTRFVNATSTLVALMSYPTFTEVIKKWCLEPMPLTCGRDGTNNSLLWRRMMLTSDGTATGYSILTGLSFLRQLLGKNCALKLTASERGTIAATAVRFALYVDPISRDITPSIVELALETITNAADKRRPPLPPLLACVKFRRYRRRAEGGMLDQHFYKLAETLSITIDDDVFIAACVFCSHAMVRKVLESSRSIKPIPPVASRAAVLCTLDVFLGAQHVAINPSWWDWPTVLHGLNHGLRFGGTTYYPVTEVLDIVVPQLPLQLPSAPAPHIGTHFCGVGRANRSSWSGHMLKALLQSGYDSPLRRPIVRGIVHRSDTEMLRVAMPAEGTQLIDWCIRVDSVFLLSKALSMNGQTTTYNDHKSVGGMPLLHLACFSQSPNCVNFLIKNIEPFNLVEVHEGLTAMDICAGTGWLPGAESLAKCMSARLGINISDVYQRIFFPRNDEESKEKPTTSAAGKDNNSHGLVLSPTNISALLTERFSKPLLLFAQMNITAAVHKKCYFVGDPNVFLRSVKFIQKPEIATHWSRVLPKSTLEEAAFIVARRNYQIYLISALLDAGVRINAQDPNTQCTLLHYAVRRKHAVLVELLATRGADTNIANTHGDLPLHEAYALRHAESVDILRPRTVFPAEYCYTTWDVRLWFKAAQEFHTTISTSQRVSKEFPPEIPLAGFWLHPMVGRSLSMNNGPYLQPHFPPPNGEFALVAAKKGGVNRGVQDHEPREHWEAPDSSVPEFC